MIRAALLMAAALPGGATPLSPATPPLGGPAVVVLWASWCVACRAEMARLPQLRVFAASHVLKIGTIQSLIDWRREND
ncbi:hypothetical protein [Sphingomonas bacterium]|uniref:hypothetical protein n=1 Tax=Sphingomonas bacterium TaxID=1895847 RepID=UPI001575CA91|nr:hypothetical protein [Sphingomonas bacterium]